MTGRSATLPPPKTQEPAKGERMTIGAYLLGDEDAHAGNLGFIASTDQGIDWSIICAATLMTSAPLLLGFLLFQRQFVQSFMRAGIR